MAGYLVSELPEGAPGGGFTLIENKVDEKCYSSISLSYPLAKVYLGAKSCGE